MSKELKFINRKQKNHFKKHGVYVDTNSKIAEWMVEYIEKNIRDLYNVHENKELYKQLADSSNISDGSPIYWTDGMWVTSGGSIWDERD